MAKKCKNLGENVPKKVTPKVRKNVKRNKRFRTVSGVG